MNIKGLNISKHLNSSEQQTSKFRDHDAESALFIRRAIIAFVIMIAMVGVLLSNIYNLQINRFDDYSTRSNSNRIKLIPIAPNRGIIYDRNGTPLAINETIYQLEAIPEKINNIENTFAELRPLIGLTDDDISNFYKERKSSPRFTPIVIKSALTEQQIAHFIVNQYRFPELQIKGYQRRIYPFGSAMTHVVGYVSKINDQEIKKLAASGRLADYRPTHDIGKTGIERYYEEALHGKAGYEEVEVNSRGHVVRQLNETPPLAGKDIYLTIDLKLQQYIEKLLGNRRAAVVAVNPNNGEILALVSSPSYDANLFVNGISSKNFQKLLNDPDRPLINRATQGAYPPGSTVKPFIAAAALTTGVITPNTTIFDPGWWQLPQTERRYRDWKRGGHGRVNVTKAIEESSDTFFYNVAYDMGIDRLSTWMKQFGFGSYTGIDLAEEQAGIMPSREWKMLRHKQTWFQGDTIPVGIGQGYWSATPLQLAKALTILINDGEVKTPHLLLKDGNQPYIDKNQRMIHDIPAEYWHVARDGMYKVLYGPTGTARNVFKGTPYRAAGKSGTSQVFSLKADEVYHSQSVAAHLRDHALFIAYAPYDKPKVALAVILENGGSGGINAGAVARKILDYIFVGDHSTAIPSEMLRGMEVD